MAQPTPPYVEGHGLLAGKTVVVTAAAGTGIGYAVAKRCVEEGATVLISDIHERRLGRGRRPAGRGDGAAARHGRCATSPSRTTSMRSSPRAVERARRTSTC